MFYDLLIYHLKVNQLLSNHLEDIFNVLNLLDKILVYYEFKDRRV